MQNFLNFGTVAFFLFQVCSKQLHLNQWKCWIRGVFSMASLKVFKNIIINVDIETRMFWFLNSPKQNILTINCKDCLYTTAQVIGDKNFKYNQDQRLWQSQYLPAAYVVSVQKHCQFLLTGIVQEVVSSLYKCVSSRGLLTCRFFLKSVRLMKIRYFSLFAL